MPARRYEVRIAGRLSARVREAFVGMDVEPVPPETVIAGTVDDDDELHRLLALIQSLGLHVVAVEQVAPEPHAHPRPRGGGDATATSDARRG
jgi:ribosomal protein S11